MATEKPSELSLWLYYHNIGIIKVEQVMTSADETTIYIHLVPTTAFGEIESKHKSKKVLKEDLMQLIDYRIDWCSVLRLTREENLKCKSWIAFEKKNAKELSEYKRLKKKFE